MKISAKNKLKNLYETALTCIEYVGSANYPERERAAMAAIEKSHETGLYISPRI